VTLFPITVLAIDPGQTSGWAVVDSRGVYRNGLASNAEDRRVVVRDYADRVDVIVREKWSPGGRMTHQTSLGMGATWGRWLEALELGNVATKIVAVKPEHWRKVLGGGRRTREQWKVLAVALAKQQPGHVNAGDDSAEAVCIGLWALRAPEVWEALPASKRRRLERESAA
jgi:hypothetical protein